MGNAFYSVLRNGEEIEAGYGVQAVCEEPGCTEVIDRGLAYLCGQTPGGDEYGCGGYFCPQHLHIPRSVVIGDLCARCLATN
ncbi:hypothetical protein [Streptomyces lunaelactis]|uniref:hypothetical protein n=1 Tax=Streptomyces lunaelactis TaxID=1535768 RepID=UPI0015845E56|nr:hypothetical protein [Streptomyces lunaelactis]NUK00583.1 hypothetical protein [Streptomyces lunaelactis]NUK14744.1 hypothetical protein [Streptomyces lunaelactis]